MAALDGLTFQFSASRQITAEVNKTGSNYQSIKVNPVLTTPKISIKKTVANAAAGGGDTVLSSVFSITGGGTATIDLSSFTDIMERSGGSFARIKYIEFFLLGTADDASVGTAASSVTIGNAASNANAMFLGDQAHEVVLQNGDFICYGSRKAAGITVDGTHKSILITNNDGSVTAKLQVTIVGGST